MALTYNHFPMNYSLGSDFKYCSFAYYLLNYTIAHRLLDRDMSYKADDFEILAKSLGLFSRYDQHRQLAFENMGYPSTEVRDHICCSLFYRKLEDTTNLIGHL